MAQRLFSMSTSFCWVVCSAYHRYRSNTSGSTAIRTASLARASAAVRVDDEDDDEREDATPKPTAAPVGALIQKKFLEQRKIFLWGAVEDASARDIVEKLLYLDGIDPGKEITFYINTPGGSITSGMAVYDTIRMIS